MQDVYAWQFLQPWVELNTYVSSSVTAALLAGRTNNKCDTSSMCLICVEMQTVEVQGIPGDVSALYTSRSAKAIFIIIVALQ